MNLQIYKFEQTGNSTILAEKHVEHLLQMIMVFVSQLEENIKRISERKNPINK